MAIFSHNRHHWAYVWIPAVGSIVWCGTLLAMIVTWAAQGKPIYVSEDGTIPYISDIGADILKPLFIVGCSFNGVSLVLALTIERILRHRGRLVPSMRKREAAFSYLAILGSIIGGAGVILLSIFDTKRHPSLHRGFLLMFLVGVVISAFFTIGEYMWLSKDYPMYDNLKKAYIAKAIITTILVVCAIVFGITLYTDGNVGGIFEWIIAFGYTFYLLSFAYDLRLSKGAHRGQFSHEQLMLERERHQMAQV
ncbi:uncharacterized protein STEHIDRAFT_48451 [Stereum hirsutum FP-91666 SS1]|uniref:uncharacterized protein n=1 Tax=Stereum hirsutum (strain FP-91666) TaxID=721885 RepID=UPI000440C977|nr:uncharacterized protein STEHIDRAFT_48451 [Stereum hirsutum FP-91666 SS1]EIM91459.1 hypothetical protein STEHIDRAFT_48451 [Stereum hirsutum FP-91666 SS1]